MKHKSFLLFLLIFSSLFAQNKNPTKCFNTSQDFFQKKLRFKNLIFYYFLNAHTLCRYRFNKIRTRMQLCHFYMQII
jgi:hypothetical protein